MTPYQHSIAKVNVYIKQDSLLGINNELQAKVIQYNWELNSVPRFFIVF